MKNKQYIGLLFVALTGCSSLSEQALSSPVRVDITADEAFIQSVSSQYPDEIAGEGLAQLFDDSLKSKYLSTKPNTWIQVHSPDGFMLKEYRFTSAQDAPMRDPANWRVLGSVNETTWHEIDTVSDFSFSSRGQTAAFVVDNQKVFNFYRFELSQKGTTQWGDNYLQLADLALFVPTLAPVVDFTAAKNRVAPNETVFLKSTTQNKVDEYVWSANGVALQTNGDSATVTFTAPGSYDVSLSATNQYGRDEQTQHRLIKVLDAAQPWQGFETPKVVLNFVDHESQGYQRLVTLFPDLTRTIDEVTRELVKKLYKNYAQVPDFKQVEFKLEWMDTLAYRAGDDTNMIISFSSKYIATKLQSQPDEVVKYELLGVLWHELTHGYQLFPANTSYAEQETHAFIEGMADLIRIDAGYHQTRSAKKSESWLGGYTNTGFFLKWLSDNKINDFAYRFNQTANTVAPWSFKKAIESLSDEPLEQLWQQYQASLTVIP